MSEAAAGGTPAAGDQPGGTPAGGQPNANQQPGQQPGQQPAGQQPAGEVKPDAGSEPGSEPQVKPVKYEATGNVGLDMALEFIGGLGIKPDDPAMLAAAAGDFAQLEALMRGLGDKAKGYERFLALGKDAYGKFAEEQKAKAQAAKDAIFNVVGGEERWKAVQEWAKANAEDGEREAVNAALQSGDIVSRAVAFYLNHRFTQATGTVVEPAERVARPDAGGKPSGGNAPLSPREYAAEVSALRTRLGSKFEGSKEYSQLQARRRAYRG